MTKKKTSLLDWVSAGPQLNRILHYSCAALFLSGMLAACGPSPDAEKLDDTDTSKSASAEEELDDIDDSAKEKKPPKPPKPKLSTEGKKTGVLVDGYEFEQKNEFLGATKLKLCKFGIRLESPNLLCVMLPGQEAIAYNPQNGNCMQLTAKSAAMLAGKRPNEGPTAEVIEPQKGTEMIAGLKCNKYIIRKFFPGENTSPALAKANMTLKKQKSAEALKKEGYFQGWHTEFWSTKDINVPAEIVKDTARLTMMPGGLGFPVRIQREVDGATTVHPTAGPGAANSKTASAGTDKSAATGGLKPVAHVSDDGTKSSVRKVIDTTGFAKAKFDKGEFALLEGFKTVKDEMQLMMSSDESDLEGMGLDDDPKEGKDSKSADKDKKSESLDE